MAWEESASCETYWGMRCRRDGVGQIRPAGALGNEGFYRQFASLSGDSSGEVDWLLWWDPLDKKWDTNTDLLASLTRTATASPTSVITALPSSTSRSALLNAAGFLNGCLRAGSGGFMTSEINAYRGTKEEVCSGRIGVQMWSKPARLDNGNTALFLLPRNTSQEHAGCLGDLDGAAAEDIISSLQIFVYALSSTLVAFEDDDSTSPEDWWKHIIPQTNVKGEPILSDELEQLMNGILSENDIPESVLPHIEATGRALYSLDAPVKGPRLHVVTKNNLALPGLRNAGLSVRNAVGVASWLAYFSEVVFLSDARGLPEDIFGLSEEKWGAMTEPIRPGAMWHSMACLTTTLPQYLAAVTGCVDAMNEVASDGDSRIFAMKHALTSQALGEHLAGGILEAEVDVLRDFYMDAMLVELDNAPKEVDAMAHLGQTSEPPANVSAPLWASSLIQHHEQHFFSTCRRLMLRTAEAGVDTPIAMKYFESLKNKISDRFLTAWCVNQKRSKTFCKATFELCFQSLSDKYLSDSTTVAIDADSEKGNKSASLKKFHQTFMDLLDEYEIKAIGTRRGDVMLTQTKDLLQRIQDKAASTGNDSAPLAAFGGMRLSDLSLAVADINSEVTKRVLNVTSEMEISRSELQKTCALYTKLLGMQCRQRIAGCRHQLWRESVDSMVLQGQARSRMYYAALGLGSLCDDLEEDIAHYALASTEAHRALEKQTGNDIDAFLATLPFKERTRYYRFGVVNNGRAGVDTSGDATSLVKLHEQAQAAGAKISKKARGFFSKMKGKVM